VPSLKRRLLSRNGAFLLAATWLAAPAPAALVILEDGRTVKAVGFELRDDRVVLSLPDGGRLAFDLERVDRIVDDEIEPAPPPEAPATAAPPPRRSVRMANGGQPAAPPAFRPLILAAAKEHHLDPALISAVIRAESAFSPRAVSPKGARGLMQLMPATARRLGVRQPFDPVENVRGGAAYLSELASRFGETEVELILAAYNAGERAVELYQGIPPFRETRDYVRRVSAYWSPDR